MGGARKWHENEKLQPRSQAMWEELGSGLRTRLQHKVVEVVASLPSHVGGARKWFENGATAMDWVGVELWYV